MTERQALIKQLIADIADSVSVLRKRDGLPITDEMAEERARNIVTGLLGNYNIRPL